MTSTGTKLLEVRDLSVAFGTGAGEQRVVDGVSFAVGRNQTLVLVGESGSGKSLSALSVLRLLPYAARIPSGEIRLDGTDLLALPEAAMRRVRGDRVGMIFQEPQSALNPVMTIGAQIAEVLAIHKGLKGRSGRERVIELLDQVGIPDPARRATEYPHQFSGGMKQRAMIAMAIAGEPDVLIADEPTTALDVTIQAQVLALIARLQEEHGMAIVFITHDLAVARQVATEVAVMQKGRIVETGPADRFFREHRHPYTRQLFEAIPSRAGRLADGIDEGVDMASAPILKTEDLKVHFPIKAGVLKRTVGHVHALDGVSIDLHRGETVAVVGESGSGKTTMGKGILKLIEPTGGRVYFGDREITGAGAAEWRRLRAKMQVVFQDPVASMNPRMMVGDIVKEGMRALRIGASEEERDARVFELLEEVGLEASHRFRYPHEFSGGQRQRICIARALAVDPEVVICDEPTSALDVSVQAQILRLLRRLQVEKGIAYLFVTHNIAVVEYIAHRVAVMYQGRIVEQGPVAQVLYRPSHDYTKKLLAAVPRLETAAAG